MASLTLLTSCLAVLASCSHQVGVGGPVPAVTPDTLPDWIYDHETSDSPVLSGTFLTNILTIVFESEASQIERQHAVDSVNGQVVGGRRLFGDDGYYYVLVEDDHPETPGQALVEAMKLLDSLPQVAGASPVQLFRKMGAAVPAVAPDTVPAGFYDSENIRTGSACTSGRMLRGIVSVTFNEGTTQADKQAAIDLIDGEVVGGILPGDGKEGYYYVRVEDDPDGQVLCNAIEELNALPQVGYASPSLLGSPLSRACIGGSTNKARRLGQAGTLSAFQIF